MVGASFSMKKRLSAVNERKMASEASLSTPPIRPWVRASKPALIEELPSAFASAAVGALTPRSRSRPSTSLAPSRSLSERLSAWPANPIDERRGDRGDDRRREDRHHDRLRQREEPDRADQRRCDSDQEPRREA